MAVLRRLAAGAAVAAIGTLGIASAANAAVSNNSGHHKRWYVVEHNGSLVEISDNNVGPFQVCHNNVPVNVVGGQVPISDVIGVLGIGSNGNTATQVHNCSQDTTQNNDGDPSKQWYRVDDNGGLIEISDNNVGPFQVCDNNVPVNGVGAQVPIDDVTGILGIASNGNTATLIESCEQATDQNNDGPNPSEPAPTTSNPEPSTSNPEPSTSNPEPSTSNPSPSDSGNAPKPTPVETNAPVTG